MTRTSPQNGSISWDFEEMRWKGITIEQIGIWQKLYPDVSMVQVLKVEIPQWIDKQIVTREPLRVNKIARKKDWKRTICNWLKKEQMKAVGL